MLPEYDRDILNQIYVQMCAACPVKYWEGCTGPHTEFGVLSCRKARKLYEKLAEQKEKEHV